jgi:hypothetical protein
MPVGEEALRVDDKLALAAPGGDRGHALGGFGLQRAARGDDGVAHPGR